MREIRAGEWDNSRYSQRSAAAAVSRLSKRNRHVFLRKNPDIGGRSCGEAEETYDSKPNPNTNLARHRLYQKAGSFEFALVFLVPPPGSQPATFLRLTLLTWLAIAIQHREVCPRRTSHLCTHAYFGHADELSRGVETISDDTLLMAVLKVDNTVTKNVETETLAARAWLRNAHPESRLTLSPCLLLPKWPGVETAVRLVKINRPIGFTNVAANSKKELQIPPKPARKDCPPPKTRQPPPSSNLGQVEGNLPAGTHLETSASTFPAEPPPSASP